MLGAKRFGSQSEICIRRTARTMLWLEGLGVVGDESRLERKRRMPAGQGPGG